MTEKVKVSREVAEAIEFLKKEFDYNFEAFMKVSLNDGWHINKNCTALNKISVEDLAKILINGYEVEQTPEEKVEEYYKKLLNSDDTQCKNMALAVSHSLSLLKKRIKGVNA